MKHAYLVGTCLFLAGPAFGQSTASTVDFVKTVAISFAHVRIESRPSQPWKKMFLATKIVAQRDWTSNTNRCLKSCGPKTAPILQSRGRRCFHLADINEVFELLGGLSKDYNQMQLAGHKEAVALSNAKTGDNAALKNWAAKTLPYLQEHLALAEKLSHR